MSYSDQKYHSKPIEVVALNTNVGTATATASGHVVTNTACLRMPKFIRASKINSVRVAVDTIPVVGAAGTTLVFLNGTSTFGSVAVGTATAGQAVDATMTLANGTFAINGQPTVNVTSTGTASATFLQGSYSVYIEAQELPS